MSESFVRSTRDQQILDDLEDELIVSAMNLTGVVRLLMQTMDKPEHRREAAARLRFVASEFESEQ